MHFTAAFLLFGVGVFLWIIAPPVLTRRLGKQLNPVVDVSLFVVGLTAIVWFLLTAAVMSDDWQDLFDIEVLHDVLFDTEFGEIWLLRLVFIALLVATAALSGRNRWRNIAGGTALVLGSLGFVGHAAMEPGLAALPHELNQAGHLLAAGLWIGGLVPLVLILSASILGDPAAQAALRRFSGAGHFAVAAVLATGAVNTLLILGGWPLNTKSPYQLLLLIKIVLVAAMIALAVINRYVLMPRLQTRKGTVNFLYWNTLGEIYLGLAVVGLVSYFATQNPA